MFNLGYMHEQGLDLKQDMHLAKRFYDMAAEASPDAQVPIALALAKLALLFTFKYFEEVMTSELYPFAHLPFDWIHFGKGSLNVQLGLDWDIYLMGILSVIIATLILFRRPPLPILV
ncbi:protein sel-1 homolog 1-like isoform X1 [Palaemon carinicauda]|uniref:protein sel-1 homolog 1-like isoform X1 n=1 Tax=Palaemon carinicauda TaxID=392227 RepID=UPI0035B57F27